MTKSPVVLDAKETLALDLSGVKLIEASAGTGKTYAIANLYLRFVLKGRQVSEILVVTFTNAATEELRGRIRQRLYEVLSLLERIFFAGTEGGTGETSASATVGKEIANSKDAFLRLLLEDLQSDPTAQASARDRLKLAVRTMDEAAIYTIHGFCQRALGDHAFHSGQAFQLEIATDDAQLWQQALKDWWRRDSYELSHDDNELFMLSLGSLPEFTRRQVLLRNAGAQKILPETKQSLKELYAVWRTALLTSQKIAVEWTNRREELQQILLTSKALSRTAKNGYKIEDLENTFSRLDAYFATGMDGFSVDLLFLSAAHLEASSTEKKRGTDPLLEDGFFISCGHLLDEFYDVTSQFSIRALHEATEYAAKQVEEIKQRSRSMSFSDQLTRMYTALEKPQGGTLAQNLCKAFPVAMIDEFQDTDAIQYGIFQKLYFRKNQPVAGTSLIMIGDPKQAIYSFRGGDIFTYIKARRDAAENIYTLDTNWRSVPCLINAVNILFAHRDDAFIYSDAIEFQAVKSADKPNHAELHDAGKIAAPLTFWKLPLADTGRPQSKGKLEFLLHNSVADEIARLINGGREGSIKLGDAPIQSGDIAVLVRTARQGIGVRDALTERGINAVTVGRDKVFASAEAHGLASLLQAVIYCDDRSALRIALTSELLNLDYIQIAAVIENEQEWLAWMEQMKSLNLLWLQKGFMPMFQSLMIKLDVALRIANTEHAERRLTNVLHLAELLQQTARTYPGHEALLSWYEQQITDAAEEETELRLESDEALVKIVTIHASKGLEYPVVFVPYLWNCRPHDLKSNSVLAFHDEHGEPCLDLGSEEMEQHLLLAEKERLAEDLRLAYVALTRAKAKVYLAWGAGEFHHAHSHKSALGYLLFNTQSANDLDENLPEAFSSDQDFFQPLQDLVKTSNKTIEAVAVPGLDDPVHISDENLEPVSLAPAQFTGQIATDWRINSFSSLTRDVHQAPQRGAPRSSTSDPILSFPAGSHVGLFLHSLLEETDFTQDTTPQIKVLFDKYAGRYGLDNERMRETVDVWVRYILQTPLRDDGFKLQDLPINKRLDEMAFDFSAARVSITFLNQTLAAGSMPPLNALEAADFRGMVNGIIDLIFEHNGRFYIADYKSNFLGADLRDYDAANLRTAMLDRRYDLQYLLYTVALQRYLRQRLQNYSYAEHFGGVYYLFLRGMRPESGVSCGVFFDKPDQTLIDALDTQVFGASVKEQTERSGGA